MKGTREEINEKALENMAQDKYHTGILHSIFFHTYQWFPFPN